MENLLQEIGYDSDRDREGKHLTSDAVDGMSDISDEKPPVRKRKRVTAKRKLELSQEEDSEDEEKNDTKDAPIVNFYVSLANDSKKMKGNRK